MIARLDAMLPPLDPALGLYLLLAAVVGCVLFGIVRRARALAGAAPDPHATPYGDVTRRPELR